MLSWWLHSFQVLKRATGRFLLPTFIGTELEGENAFTLQLERLHFDISKRFSKAKLKAMMMLTDCLTCVSVFPPGGSTVSIRDELGLEPKGSNAVPRLLSSAKAPPLKAGVRTPLPPEKTCLSTSREIQNRMDTSQMKFIILALLMASVFWSYLNTGHFLTSFLLEKQEGNLLTFIPSPKCPTGYFFFFFSFSLFALQHYINILLSNMDKCPVTCRRKHNIPLSPF